MDSSIKRHQSEQANGAPKRAKTQSHHIESGLKLCLTALDHCSEQIASINDQEVLKQIAAKAGALQRATRTRIQSVTTTAGSAAGAARQQQQQQQQQQQGSKRQKGDLQQQQQKHQGQQLQQIPPVRRQPHPLQVVEDKQPFVFSAQQQPLAAAAPPTKAVLDGAQPSVGHTGPDHSRHAAGAAQGRQLQSQPAHLQSSQQPHTDQHQQHQQQASGSRAVLKGYINAAQAGHISKHSRDVYTAAADPEANPVGTGRAGKASSSSSSTDSGSSSTDSDDSGSGGGSSSSSGGTSTTSDTSSDSSDRRDDNSNSSSSSSDNAQDSSPPVPPDAGAAAAPAVQQQQQQQQGAPPVCLVCKRAVAASSLLQNKLTAACSVCVAAAVQGTGRLQCCPKRGCSGADVRLGPQGWHSGGQGAAHYLSVTSSGFSVHYKKPSRGSKKKGSQKKGTGKQGASRAKKGGGRQQIAL